MAAKSVLLVEDDEELRQLYKVIFEKNDFKVYEAADGVMAVDEALRSKPSLIILDLLLPRQGGLHALKILRSLPETKKLPIFVMTALPNPEYQEAAKDTVQGYFLKTQVKPQELVDKVSQFLKP